MHVDVQRIERHLDEQVDFRAAFLDRRDAVGVADRMRDGLVAHQPAVDEDVLRTTARPGLGQRRDVAFHANAGRLLVDLDQVAGIAVDLKQPLPPAAGRRTLEHPPSRADEREPHPVGTQRQLRDDARDLGRLGLIRLQELPPRGQVVEQLFDVDPRAFRRPDLRDRPDDAAVHLDLGAAHRAAGAGAQRQVRHRRDRRQRFAAEAERRDGRQVAARPDLARRVPLQRQLRIVWRHPLAVVFDADQTLAAVLDRHRHPPRAGVDGVFDEFLDDGGGRSTTSPAAIWLASATGRRWIFGISGYHDANHGNTEGTKDAQSAHWASVWT